MENALAWIGHIAEWFGQFIPRREILSTTEGAIKYVQGSKTVVCGPGVHWWWPWTTVWQHYPVVRQVDRLQTQTMVTTDDKCILVGAVLTYSVYDIKALLPTTHDPQVAVKDLAATAVHDVCCSLSWDDLKLEQRRGTLDTKLKNAAQRVLKDYGVSVLKLMLIDLSPTRVLRLSQSTSQEEN